MEFFRHLSILLFVVYIQFHSIHSTPSIEPNKNFDAKVEAEKLQKALITEADGIDDEGVKNILTTMTCAQRVEMATAYKAAYNKDVTQEIDGLTGSSYRDLLKDSFLCGEDLLATHINRALQVGADNWEVDGHIQRKSIIEIMVTCSESKEKHDNLLASYQKLFQSSLQEAFEKNLDGDFKNVMLEFVARTRQPIASAPDDAKAQEAAQMLNDGRDKWDDKRQHLDATLMETDFRQLALVYTKFKEISGGEELKDAIDNELSGSLKNTYQDLVYFCSRYDDFVGYFSLRLYEAVTGMGSDEQTLIRVILTQSEKYIREIEPNFQERIVDNQTLESRISDDIEGAFKGLLLGYLKGNTSSAR